MLIIFEEIKLVNSFVEMIVDGNILIEKVRSVATVQEKRHLNFMELNVLDVMKLESIV